MLETSGEVFGMRSTPLSAGALMSRMLSLSQMSALPILLCSAS